MAKGMIGSEYNIVQKQTVLNNTYNFNDVAEQLIPIPVTIISFRNENNWSYTSVSPCLELYSNFTFISYSQFYFSFMSDAMSLSLVYTILYTLNHGYRSRSKYMWDRRILTDMVYKRDIQTE